MSRVWIGPWERLLFAKAKFKQKIYGGWNLFWAGPEAQHAMRYTPLNLLSSTAQLGQSPMICIPWSTDIFLVNRNARHRNDKYLRFIMALQSFSGSHWWSLSMALAQRWGYIYTPHSDEQGIYSYTLKIFASHSF
jgi:hypothetical protein